MKHLHTEHEGIKFECPICGQIYRGFFNAQTHLNKIHSIPRGEIRGMVKVVINEKGERTTMEYDSTDDCSIDKEMDSAELGLDDTTSSTDTTTKDTSLEDITTSDLSSTVEVKVEADEFSSGTVVALATENGVTSRLTSYDCEYCDKSFHQARDKNDHVNFIHNKIRYKCPVCQKLLSKYRAVTRHMRLDHGIRPEQLGSMTIDEVTTDSDKSLRPVSESSGPFKCTECPQSFLTNYLRVSHLEGDHEGVRFECPICTKPYRGFNGTKAHLHKMHGMPRSELDGLIQAVINVQGERTVMENDPLHPADDPKSGLNPDPSAVSFDCEICDKSFRESRNRDDHVNYAHKNIRYKCPVCHKLLSTHKIVKRHIKVTG